MTWIKPSFVWMGYRCGWSRKDANQSRVLALDLHRAAFDKLLLDAVLASSQAARGERVDAGSSSDIVVQWDPERALGGDNGRHAYTHPTPAQRSLQMGLRGEATRLLAAAEDGIIAAITDVTSAFAAVGAHLEAGEVDAAAALLPTERLYPLPAGCAITDRAEMAATIPTVDFAPFMRDEGVTVGAAPTDAQAAVAAQIDAVCRGDGFVHLVNFGLTPELEAAAFAASTELFALPDEHKLSELSRIAPQTNTGYSPFAFENLNRSRPPDLKEAFNVRAGSGHVTSFAGCPARFETTALELWDVLVKAARRYALALALALGLERDYFERSLEKMDLCTLRFLHYPPCDGPTEEADGTRAAVRVGEHTDFGAFTFLLLGEGAVGLQVKKIAGAEVGGAAGGEAGGWLDVETPPRSEGGAVGAIVNTGALMARWTNDTWRATAHRVVVPTAAAAAAHRYSVACFIDPDADARVAVDARFVAPGEEARYEPTTGLAYLLMKLREAQK